MSRQGERRRQYLPYYQGAQRSIGGNEPVKTGRGSIPLALDKLPTMSEEDQFALLASDGMLVKRPILIGDGFVLVGFNEDAWRAVI